MRALPPLLAVLALLLALPAGCWSGDSGPGGRSGDAPGPGLHGEPGEGVQRLKVRELDRLPHDRSAFTQGLEMVDGVLYEGTGRPDKASISEIRTTDLQTGAVRRRAELPPPLFGEGITVVGPHIWQLTWRDGVAIKRDRSTLAELERVRYDGEGWGLCHDGQRLIMSDGTDRLQFRSPSTFEPIGEVPVRQSGRPVAKLNELECAGGVVWANVWQTDRILRIDPRSGAVTGIVDASGLLTAEERAGADVLNGIAALPGGTEFLITGKRWPYTFRVQFVPA